MQLVEKPPGRHPEQMFTDEEASDPSWTECYYDMVHLLLEKGLLRNIMVDEPNTLKFDMSLPINLTRYLIGVSERRDEWTELIKSQAFLDKLP